MNLVQVARCHRCDWLVNFDGPDAPDRCLDALLDHMHEHHREEDET